jgi:hypothetical protein
LPWLFDRRCGSVGMQSRTHCRTDGNLPPSSLMRASRSHDRAAPGFKKFF